MGNLLDIIGDDIAQLSDADLRTLIGLLCEFDYLLAGLPTKGIIWGGRQDARDGGLDVVIREEVAPPPNSFVPRNSTGFQVKKSDMPPGRILDEMKPKGILREEIKSLIRERGAYIIVSSDGSTSNTALNNRIASMKRAVEDEEHSDNIHLDFFDRGRIATWVRSHPSMILWVLNKIGRPLKGWRPYENWSKAPGGIKEEYLLDDSLRLHDGNKRLDEGISARDGILRLRSLLSTPSTSVRLTGLSGVGKTRFVEAMFDERVGDQALKRSQAFYTDMSYGPDPDPCTFAEQLIAQKTRGILIVDNCPPGLHRRLTKTCSGSHSTVSLLTVEYDVRDDIPDETSVFRLEPASVEIIEKLIKKRYQHISEIDARTIANFSGGNARLAIALANTVQTGQTLSDFRDEELFERLFIQRHGSSENLLVSAEVCSLVYSFEGVDTVSENSELKFLASIVSKSAQDLYRDIVSLKERELLQSRDVWRAVLPQAIANRLAKRALESIPKEELVKAFITRAPERLLKSFTRRLSYLHDCQPAIEIVNEWLAPDGWIGKEVCRFNSLGLEIFRNIASVSPEIALKTIERAASGDDGIRFTSRENAHYYEFVRLLRQFAYDPELFARSLNLLCRYALSEEPEEKHNSIRDVVKTLFYILLSGTHASAEARASIINEMVESDNQNTQNFGLYLLDATLETWHFSSYHEFNFGARPRDYGYRPKSREDVIRWYETFINICTRLAVSKQPIAQKAMETLAKNLRGLWTKGGMFDSLENAARQILKQGAWNEGWISVRGIIRYDKKAFEGSILKRLCDLEKLLRPVDLLQLARTYALSEQHHTFDLEDDIEEGEDVSSALQRVEETTRKIGAQVAQDAHTLNKLLPELVSTRNGRLISFGKGLADGCGNRQELWQILRSQLIITPLEIRELGVFYGFLSSCAENHPVFYRSTLDSLISDKVLGEWFPYFQTTSTIDQRGVERLNEALDIGIAKIGVFSYLACGRAHESISDNDLANLLKKILAKENGINVVIRILNMRYHGSDKSSRKYSDNLIGVGRDVLSKYSFPDERNTRQDTDYSLAQIAKSCLIGSDGSSAAAGLCENLEKAIADNRIYTFNYPNLLKSLARTQPFVFLDVFLGSGGIVDYQRRKSFFDGFERLENPLNQISDEDIILWCDKEPGIRYPIIASTIQPFSESEDAGAVKWKPIVYSIFKKAPDLQSVLEQLAGGIRPRSWSGSMADILEKRSALFQSLFEHDNTEICAWARKIFSAIQEMIKTERDWEVGRNRQRNESFE